MKIFTKESAGFIMTGFIIWSIFEIIIDLITGVSLSEMLSVRYIVSYLVGAFIFALMLWAFQLWSNRKKK